MKALAYTRISTSDQSEHSLDYQERMIREYCEKHQLELSAIFKDDGQSSYTFDRPDFKALEAFIRKNKDVTHLIILDMDRFSRNLAEALMKIHELQSKHHIKVLATSDNFDTDFTDPANFMMRAFKLMMAESELHNIRKRTKAGMVQAALSGRWSSKAPYGYKNARDAQDKPLLVIDDDKALVIRTIFREWLNGMDIYRLLVKAREMGYRQKSHSAIQRILSNPVYAGLIPVPAHKGRKKPIARGIHAPIISEEDFWMAQDRFSGKKKGVHARETVYLRGALRCWCGRLVTAGNSKNRLGKEYWYYLCPEHRENFSAKKLHATFQELLETLSISPERLAWLREKLIASIGDRLRKQAGEVDRVEKELKQLRRAIVSTERRYLTSSNISQETFEQIMVEMKADEVRLQRQRAVQQQDPEDYFERLDALLNKATHLWQAFTTWPLEKQWQFINQVFDQPFHYRDGSYRTPGVHPAFADNLQVANEKGLLKIEKPSVDLSKIPLVPQAGSLSNLFERTMALLELIA